MTRDEMIKLAQKALKQVVTEDYPGHAGKLDPWTMCLLERFAQLVAAHEREACAMVCDNFADDPVYCGELIRTRGQQ